LRRQEIKFVESHLRASASFAQSARAELLADSGLTLAALDLVGNGPASGRSRRFPLNATPVSCALDNEGRLTIRLQDAGGRVNLNTASDRLLQALLIGLGVERSVAIQSVDALIEFRSPPGEGRRPGAEKADYVAAGRPLGPKNAPLDSLDELFQVPGFDAALIERMTPHITIYSGTAGLDPDVTTPGLAGLLARAVSDLPGGAQGLNSATRVPGEFIIASTQRVFVATVAARLETGAGYIREAVIDLAQNRTGLLNYKVWKRGAVGIPPDEANGLAPPC
jgi:type II secretory pathway component PulK